MRRLAFLLLGFVAGLAAGCAKKEITGLQRKEAAALASEASFAISIRDYARAEGNFAKAAELCPDTSEYFLGLGTARRRMENRAGAKKAFESALDASRDAYKRNSKNPQLLLQQAYLLALLGRVDDARATLEKARANHPDDRAVRSFIDSNQLNRLLADPSFKELVP